MKRFEILLIFLFIVLSAVPLAARNDETVKNSVVRIEVVSKEPYYVEPWSMQPQKSLSGSGCIISGKRILTNAHVVADATFIQVQRAGDVTKYPAKVEYIGHDCDLALLKVSDSGFFANTEPFELGTIPELQDRVAVFGFPQGGEKISITQGIVSRIELASYSHSWRQLLAVQIDAAINSGNSGGPVILDETLAGIAFETDEKSENIGFIIPVPVIKHFLEDVSDGTYNGFPDTGARFQKLESPVMRKWLGMKEDQTGVFVTEVEPETSAWETLEPGDVLLSVSGIPVANDGTVAFDGDERIDFPYIFQQSQVGELVPMEILRKGVLKKTVMKMKTYRTLVPLPKYDSDPDYFISGGFVFLPETTNYLLQGWKRNEPPLQLIYLSQYGRITSERKQVVVIGRVLPHEVNMGYHDLEDAIVKKVNNIHISALPDVERAFLKPVDGYHIIELEDGRRVVLDAAAVAVSHEEILKRYRIPKDSSGKD